MFHGVNTKSSIDLNFKFEDFEFEDFELNNIIINIKTKQKMNIHGDIVL